LYASGYAFVGLADFSFEIDDEGTPFWVVTKYEKRKLVLVGMMQLVLF
jgi:hypothetical protein